MNQSFEKWWIEKFPDFWENNLKKNFGTESGQWAYHIVYETAKEAYAAATSEKLKIAVEALKEIRNIYSRESHPAIASFATKGASMNEVSKEALQKIG